MTTTPAKTDQSICIASLKRGDQGAFMQFIRKYQNMVFACCRAAGLRDGDVEDAAGETFLAAYKSIQMYSGQGKLSSWLWKIAYHKALDHRKKFHAETTPLGERIAALPASTAAPEANLSAEEQTSAVWQAVGHLDQPQAAAIVLFYREGKSIEEIARILEMSENTIKTNLYRGRKELYSRLQSIWETNYVRQ